jgi:tetratricopeptide (TPR) repeat protein
MQSSVQSLVEKVDPGVLDRLQHDVDLGSKALEQNNPDMAITFFRSALNKASYDFPFYDHITHNLLLSYKARIDQLLSNDRRTEARELLAAALKLDVAGAMDGDDAFLAGFADAFQNLGVLFFENVEFEASLLCCRKAISVHPSPAYHVNLTNTLSILKQRPLLSDFTAGITLDQLGRHIFIACVPKSASTFLKNVLVGLSGYRDLFAVYSSWQADQDIYLPSVIEYAGVNTVTQQHCRASETNVQIMQAFGIRPVILVRDIFDAVISMHDFYRQGAYFNSYFREDFMKFNEAKQIDLLIDNVVPWYLQFVSSWQRAEREKRLETYWLKYEELTANKAAEIGQLLEFYGLGAARANINRVLQLEEADTRKNRFNKGIAGRGKTSLTAAQKQRIIDLTEYYPAADFTCIGM